MQTQQNAFVLAILGYAAQRGLSVPELCANAKINLPLLQAHKGSVATKQLERLWLDIRHLTNDPVFGIHLGESLQLSALGVVGEIIKSSCTVGEALNHVSTIIPQVTDLFEMRINRSEKIFSLEFLATSNSLNVTFLANQIADFLLVFSIHELDGLLLRKMVPQRVYLPYSIDRSLLPEYERVLRVAPKKGTGYLIEFPVRFLNEPIITANHDLQMMLLKEVNQHKRTSPQNFKSRVQHFLMTNAYLGVKSLNDTAANFHLTPRSLQRKLKAEGISFQQLADEVRKSIALDFIKADRYPLKEISVILGYHEISAFSRAFKRWTGKTPGSYVR